MDNLYLTWKTLLLVGDMLANFVDILPETSISSACWEMGGNSHGCPLTVSICLISATRGGGCQSTQGVSYGHRLQCYLSAGKGAAQISIT